MRRRGISCVCVCVCEAGVGSVLVFCIASGYVIVRERQSEHYVSELTVSISYECSIVLHVVLEEKAMRRWK